MRRLQGQFWGHCEDEKPSPPPSCLDWYKMEIYDIKNVYTQHTEADLMDVHKWVGPLNTTPLTS